MNDIELPNNASFRLLRLVFTPNLDWKSYVQSVAKQASQRVRSLFRSLIYLTPETILYLYKATTPPCMEYCSHIWSGAPKPGCLDLHDRVHRKLVNLIGIVLSSTPQPLSHRRVVASLSLFYKYYHGRCSQELSSLVPHRRLSVRLTCIF